MIEEIEIGETDVIPRQRWFFFGYVLTMTRSPNSRITLIDAIKEFREIHGISESEEALKRRYYRLLELHTNCLKHGI